MLIDRRMLKLTQRIVTTSWKTIGIRSALTTGIFGLPLVTSINATLLLDDLFYRRYKKIPVKKPVFVLGLPRSGTTFFHRLLTHTGDFSCFKTWHIFVPSLTVRALLSPAIPLISRLVARAMYRGGKVYPDGSHKVGANLVEEDELLLLWRMDTPFLYKTPLAFDDRDNSDLLPYSRAGRPQGIESIEFLKGCLQRQILYTGRPRVVAKMPSSTMRIEQLLRVFPDARFVYLVRSPFRVIMSNLTQHRNYFDSRWGLDRIPEDRLKAYFRLRYNMLVSHYKYGLEIERRGLVPRDQLMVVPYNRLLADLEGVFQDVVDFADLEPSEALCEHVRETSRRQPGYKASHRKLRLEAFGLKPEEVLSDLREVFAHYGFSTEPPREDGSASGAEEKRAWA